MREAYFVKLRVHAAKKKVQVKKKASDSFEIHVKAPAERGAANKEAMELLAKALRVPLAALRMTRGRTTPNKIVQVRMR